MKKVFLIISFISICFFLSAEPSFYDIISEFPPDRVEDLLSGQTIKYYSINDQYVPGIAYDYTMGKSKATKDYNESDAFTLGLASFIEYPESWKELEYDEKKLNIINTLLSVSTIEGITYKSYTAGDKPKVLFSEAYTLVDKDSKKEAYDVEFSYAPEEYSYEIAAYLKDSIFGGNKYLIKYDISESEISVSLKKIDFLIVVEVLLFIKRSGNHPCFICSWMKINITNKVFLLPLKLRMKMPLSFSVFKRNRIFLPHL